jgi:uncharacterized protein (TIGR00369 family)
VSTLPNELWRTGFDALVGYEIDELTELDVRGHLDVRADVKQPFGLVHGGVYASIAESMASLGTAAVVLDDGDVASGLSNQTSFLRPVTEGRIHAHARRIHRGRTTWVWEVEFRDDAERLCAVSRMTIAVRPMPPGA